MRSARGWSGSPSIAGHDLKRLSDVLAELRQLDRAAARASRRRRNDDALARQMLGKWFTRRPLAREGSDRGGGLRVFGGEFACGGARLRSLERKLQLVEQPRRAFGARPVNRPPQFFDLKIEMCNQRATLRQFSGGRDSARLLRRNFRSRRNQRRFQRIEVVRKRGKIGVHESHGITKSA